MTTDIAFLKTTLLRITLCFLPLCGSLQNVSAEESALSPQVKKVNNLLIKKKFGGATIALEALTLQAKTEYAKVLHELYPTKVGDYEMEERPSFSGLGDDGMLARMKLGTLMQQTYFFRGKPRIEMRIEDLDLLGSMSDITCKGQAMLSKSEITNVFQHDAWYRELGGRSRVSLTVCIERGSVAFSSDSASKEQLVQFANDLGADFYRSFVKLLREQR